ncbi:hypothetical protein ACFL2X_07260 [Candidatus Latescibacterota bacterium]
MMKLIRKRKAKHFGILLLIIGAFIPSILYPFTSLTTSATFVTATFASRGVSYNTSLKDLEIVLVKGEWKKDNIGSGSHYEGRFAIPYKYIISFGILLSFIGIGILALLQKNEI